MGKSVMVDVRNRVERWQEVGLEGGLRVGLEGR